MHCRGMEMGDENMDLIIFNINCYHIEWLQKSQHFLKQIRLFAKRTVEVECSVEK